MLSIAVSPATAQAHRACERGRAIVDTSGGDTGSEASGSTAAGRGAPAIHVHDNFKANPASGMFWC